jgi:hypothetical protein
MCNNYLLIRWSRVLLEKLTGFAASQEIPLIYGTRKFINVLTSARHLSLFLSPVHPVPTTPSHFLKIHLNIIIPSTSGSPQWSLFPSGFPTKTLCTPLLSPYVPHAQPISSFPNFWNHQISAQTNSNVKFYMQFYVSSFILNIVN